MDRPHLIKYLLNAIEYIEEIDMTGDTLEETIGITPNEIGELYAEAELIYTEHLKLIKENI